MEPIPAPVTGNANLDHWLAILGALVPLMSAIAGLLNAKVRAAQSAGTQVSPTMLNAASVVNLLAVNLDKASQLANLARGKPTPTTTRGVLNAAPVEAPAAPAEPAAPAPADATPAEPPKQA